MKVIFRLLIDVAIVCSIVGIGVYVYAQYGGTVLSWWRGDTLEALVVGNITVGVTVADTPEKRRQGLSGVDDLAELEGKLFIFDTEGSYGMWMKDMNFPLDIIWINDDLQIVHIARNISPATYPATFTSPTPARFVLEMNAYFADTFKIAEGTKVQFPAHILPSDIRQKLNLQ